MILNKSFGGGFLILTFAIGSSAILYNWYSNYKLRKMILKKKSELIELRKRITDHSKIEDSIARGIFKKQGKYLGIWKLRFFVLTDTTLYYFDTKSGNPDGPPLGAFNVLNCRFELENNPKQKFCFRITENPPKRFYLLACDTKEDFDMWFNLLAQAKTTYENKMAEELEESALVIQQYYQFYEAQRKFAKFLQSVTKIQSIARKFIQRTRYLKVKEDIHCLQGYFHTFKAKFRLEKELTRKRVVQELVSTEKSYVFNLKLIIDVFIRPMINFNNIDSKVISLSDISGIFSNWERIYKINSVLLDLFQQRLDQWHIDQKLGDIFVSNTDSLFEYTPYVTNYEHSRKLLDKVTVNNQNFRNFLDAAQRDKRSKYLDLSSFLIQPIQRLPRYELLLRDLLKMTVMDHPDRDNLVKGVAKIREITMYINDQQKERENLSQVLQIQQELLSYKGALEKLSFSSASRLVRQGDVKIYKKKWNFMYLFNSQIIIIEKKDSTKKIRDVIPLEMVSLRDESFNPDVNLSNSDILAMSPPSSPPSLPSSTSSTPPLLSLSNNSTPTNNSSSVLGESLNSKSLVANKFKILNGKTEYTLIFDTPHEKDSWFTELTITLNRLDSTQKRMNLISSQ
ncbi:pleckstrin (PH) domain-containing protein [Tieghemostelium lacteum]|uniref:Pleckstrin (PH) domain-containing protein n=1 Tax=Tieghemostelium lacteum TaxID=361077 RepID=A0A151Z794_TIELA|nr:pleckstrin (PH) domain-containing protein [Tieghemostelium lacteum]|eukprot:KYQ89833.1 pleckstrin (PH) domain-containing protein [Tieghemostelium lacteum]